MKQTKMYVCTLEEFILVDIWIHCTVHGIGTEPELSMELNMHWKCCSLYTITTMEEKCENCS